MQVTAMDARTYRWSLIVDDLNIGTLDATLCRALFCDLEWYEEGKDVDGCCLNFHGVHRVVQVNCCC